MHISANEMHEHLNITFYEKVIQGRRVCVSNTFEVEINQRQIYGFYVRMNHCEAHLMFTSNVIGSKGLRTVIKSGYFFSDKNAK